MSGSLFETQCRIYGLYTKIINSHSYSNITSQRSTDYNTVQNTILNFYVADYFIRLLIFTQGIVDKGVILISFYPTMLRKKGWDLGS